LKPFERFKLSLYTVMKRIFVSCFDRSSIPTLRGDFANDLNKGEFHHGISRAVPMTLYVEISAIYCHAFLHQVRQINPNVSSHVFPPEYPR
jgi:hypothetical protein